MFIVTGIITVGEAQDSKYLLGIMESSAKLIVENNVRMSDGMK